MSKVEKLEKGTHSGNKLQGKAVKKTHNLHYYKLTRYQIPRYLRNPAYAMLCSGPAGPGSCQVQVCLFIALFIGPIVCKLSTVLGFGRGGKKVLYFLKGVSERFTFNGTFMTKECKTL
jgi:hypothetical protein